MNLLNDINNLEEKINNEIESFSYYKELNYICDILKKEIENYKYDSNDEYSLKKYKAFLEVFIEERIGFINKMIADKKNESVFDNRDERDYKIINELKNEITKILSYIDDNFPVIGNEVSLEFEKINKFYEQEIKNAKDSARRRFNVDIGVHEETILSIYSDTSSVLKSYINNLNAFKITHVDNIKIFVDNDIKVKKLFERAYETIKDSKVIELVKKLESNYINEINNSMDSIYANTNILLIQENMIKNGLQLDRIISLEKEKNDYYNQIINIDLNYYDINKLLEIENYVNNNNVFKEEFYKVLYTLVEKEKYVYNKYNVKPVIYNKISEKSKIILEKMFLDEIKNLDDYTKEKMVFDLKKNGYVNVIDYRYKELFDNYNFTIQTDYSKELIKNNNSLECKYVNTGIMLPHYDIINKNTGKRVDHIYGSHNNEDLFVRYGDIYRFCAHRIKTIGNDDVIFYYNKQGKRIKPFSDKSKIIRKIFDYYIVYNVNGEIIVDSNFKKVMDYRTSDIHKDILVDYTNKNILMYDGNDTALSLYDKDFNLLKKIPISKVINSSKEVIVSLNDRTNVFNEGIVSILVNDLKNKYICYYDVINMKTIDLFPIKNDLSVYGYNEQLYPYYDIDKNLLGYKNINGEVIINPNYCQANLFLGGCAKVLKNFSIEYSFINHQGVSKDKNSFLDDNAKVIRINLSKKQYEILMINDTNIYAVKTKNVYNIDLDDKIVDIDFNISKIKNK